LDRNLQEGTKAVPGLFESPTNNSPPSWPRRESLALADRSSFLEAVAASFRTLDQ
jgi:hypothetical protein